MEFVGDAISGMNMDERMTVCNMVVEAGGKNGVCPADQTTFDYVESRTSEPYEAVYSDDVASYFAGERQAGAAAAAGRAFANDGWAVANDGWAGKGCTLRRRLAHVVLSGPEVVLCRHAHGDGWPRTCGLS
jgi:hypothetical protein